MEKDKWVGKTTCGDNKITAGINLWFAAMNERFPVTPKVIRRSSASLRTVSVLHQNPNPSLAQQAPRCGVTALKMAQGLASVSAPSSVQHIFPLVTLSPMLWGTTKQIPGTVICSLPRKKLFCDCHVAAKMFHKTHHTSVLMKRIVALRYHKRESAVQSLDCLLIFLHQMRTKTKKSTHKKLKTYGDCWRDQEPPFPFFCAYFWGQKSE